MDRQKYEAMIASLQPATDQFRRIREQPEIMSETEKALCLRVPCGVFSEKNIWIPKSQLACLRHPMGNVICIKKSWVHRERLYWMVE